MIKINKNNKIWNFILMIFLNANFIITFFNKNIFETICMYIYIINLINHHQFKTQLS